MFKMALIALTALPLFAGFFPNTVHTSISSTSNTSATLKSSLPVNGMSGVIVHRYSSDLEGITHTFIQKSPREVTFINQDILHHDNLP